MGDTLSCSSQKNLGIDELISSKMKKKEKNKSKKNKKKDKKTPGLSTEVSNDDFINTRNNRKTRKKHGYHETEDRMREMPYTANIRGLERSPPRRFIPRSLFADVGPNASLSDKRQTTRVVSGRRWGRPRVERGDTWPATEQEDIGGDGGRGARRRRRGRQQGAGKELQASLEDVHILNQRRDPDLSVLENSEDQVTTAEAEELWSPGIPEVQALEFDTEDRQRCTEYTVGMLMDRFNQVRVTLSKIRVTPTADLDQQIEQYEEVIHELDTLIREKEDMVNNLKEQEAVDRWAHPMQIALLDLQTTLKQVADQKWKELQNAAVVRSEQENRVRDNMLLVLDLENWVTTMTTRTYILQPAELHATSFNELQKLLVDNQGKKKEITVRLQQLTELETWCEQLCLLESPSEAEKLTPHLPALTSKVQEAEQLLMEEEKILMDALKKAKEEEEEGGQTVAEEEKEGEKVEEEEVWSSEDEGEKPTENDEENETGDDEEGENIDVEDDVKEKERIYEKDDSKTSKPMEEDAIKTEEEGEKDDGKKNEEEEEEAEEKDKDEDEYWNTEVEEEEAEWKDEDEDEQWDSEEETNTEDSKEKGDKQAGEETAETLQSAEAKGVKMKKETDYLQQTVSAATDVTIEKTASQLDMTTSMDEGGTVMESSQRMATEASSDTFSATKETKERLAAEGDTTTSMVEGGAVMEPSRGKTMETSTDTVPGTTPWGHAMDSNLDSTAKIAEQDTLKYPGGEKLATDFEVKDVEEKTVEQRTDTFSEIAEGKDVRFIEGKAAEQAADAFKDASEDIVVERPSGDFTSDFEDDSVVMYITRKTAKDINEIMPEVKTDKEADTTLEESIVEGSADSDQRELVIPSFDEEVWRTVTLTDFDPSTATLADEVRLQQNAAVVRSEQANSVRDNMLLMVDLQNWVTTMTTRTYILQPAELQAATFSELQKLLLDNQSKNKEITVRLQQLSKLETWCEQLCLLESPSEAKKLTPHLPALTSKVQEARQLLMEEEKILMDALKKVKEEEEEGGQTVAEEVKEGEKVVEEEEVWSSEDEGEKPTEEDEENKTEDDEEGENIDVEDDVKEKERIYEKDGSKTSKPMEEDAIKMEEEGANDDGKKDEEEEEETEEKDEDDEEYWNAEEEEKEAEGKDVDEDEQWDTEEDEKEAEVKDEDEDEQWDSEEEEGGQEEETNTEHSKEKGDKQAGEETAETLQSAEAKGVKTKKETDYLQQTVSAATDMTIEKTASQLDTTTSMDEGGTVMESSQRMATEASSDTFSATKETMERIAAEGDTTTSMVEGGTVMEPSRGKTMETSTDTVAGTIPQCPARDSSLDSTAKIAEQDTLKYPGGEKLATDFEVKDVEEKTVEQRTDTFSDIAEGKDVEFIEGKAAEQAADAFKDASEDIVVERPSGDFTSVSEEDSVVMYNTRKTAKDTSDIMPEVKTDKEVDTTLEESVVEGSADSDQRVLVIPSFDEEVWRTVTLTDFDPSTATLAEEVWLQQSLASDLKEQQKLAQQLSTITIQAGQGTTGFGGTHHLLQGEVLRHVTSLSPSSSVVSPLTASGVQAQWESAHRVLEERIATLDKLLQRRQCGEAITDRCNLNVDTTQLLVDIGSSVAQLSEDTKQLPLHTENKELQVTRVLLVQYRMVKVVRTMTTWLTTTQHILLMSPQRSQRLDGHLHEIETLQRELQQIQRHITILSTQTESLSLPLSDAQTQKPMQGSLMLLQQWGLSLEQETGKQHGSLQSNLKLWQQSLQDLADLRQHLLMLKSSLLVVVVKGGGSGAAVKSLASLEDDVTSWDTELQWCNTRLCELRQRHASLTIQQYPCAIVDAELSSLSVIFMDVQRLMADARSSVTQQRALSDQYEKILKELGQFVEVGEGRLTSIPICVPDLDHLQKLLAADKEFFKDIEDHRAALDMAAEICDAATQQENSLHHMELSSATLALAERGSLQHKCLESLMFQGRMLHGQLKRLQEETLEVQAEVTSLDSGQVSVASLKSRSTTITGLQQQLHNTRPQLFQLLDQGRQLQSSMRCNALETQLKQVAEQWRQLDAHLLTELNKTETLTKHLQLLELDSKALKAWMTTAGQRLTDITQELTAWEGGQHRDPGVLQDLAQNVLEHRKDIQNQQPLWTRVVSTGKALATHTQHHPQCSILLQCPGGEDLRHHLETLEQDWTRLERIADSVEQKVYERLKKEGGGMLSSQKSVGELKRFLTTLQKALKTDADAPLSALSDVQILLKKCGMYKAELTSKQLMMDAINASSQQTAYHADPLVSKRKQKQKVADPMADLNRQWTRVSNSVNNRLQYLERLTDQWTALDTAVSEDQAWMTQQETRLTTACLHHDPHEAAVRLALEDCRTITDQLLKDHSNDLEEAEALCKSVVQTIARGDDGDERHHRQHHPEGQQAARQTVMSLQQQQNKLQGQLKETESCLEDLLGCWSSFHSLLHSLIDKEKQTRHILNKRHFRVVGPHVLSLVRQVERLKALQQELTAQSTDLDTFMTQAAVLSSKYKDDASAGPTRDNIQSSASAVKSQWNTLMADVAKQLELFQGCLSIWRDHEARFQEAEKMVEAKEEKCAAVMNAKVQEIRDQEELLKAYQALQQELAEVEHKVAALIPLSENLTRHMAPSTTAFLTSRHSALKQRVLSLRETLSRCVEELGKDTLLSRQFQDNLESLQEFLAHASEVLSTEDLLTSQEQSVLQERLGQLSKLLGQFMDNTRKLNTIMQLQHQIQTADNISCLVELSRNWHLREAECWARYRALQARTLAHEKFANRCHRWADVVASTETVLALPIASDLAGLVEQKRQWQNFERQLPGHHQVLHSIVNEGHRLMEWGEVQNPQDLQNTLQTLLQQWQSVVTQAQQRKAIINSLVEKWHRFRASSDHLQMWLGKKKEEVKEVGGVELDKPLLRMIDSLLYRVKGIQRDIELHKDDFQTVQHLADSLMTHKDACCVDDVSVTIEQLQDDWNQVEQQTEDQSKRLQDLQHQWSKSQELMVQIQGLLREHRETLTRDIPNTYDNLQEDLSRTMELAANVLHPAELLQNLKSIEDCLKKSLRQDDEDMEVLHQRVLMLSKLWVELLWLAESRQERLQEILQRWPSLEQRVDELLGWIGNMEEKIKGSEEVVTEEQLKLLKEYTELIASKGKDVDMVTSEGNCLMAMSNDAKVADIEQHLKKLQDRWQALQIFLESRQQKLQSNLDSLSLLDSQLRELNNWLSDIEQRLTAPVTYSQCSTQAIQDLLQHAQSLQQEIEDHSGEVKSVLQLCQTLLEDPEACTTHTEMTTLLEARGMLQTRWKHVADLATEREMRIEKTGELWDRFNADWETFKLWLTSMETEVEEARMTLPAAVTKEDIQKYETLQKQIHEHLPDLQSLNTQYNHLSKEGCTDSHGTLEQRCREMNASCDNLQQKLREMMEDLCRSASAYQDFLSIQQSVMAWLKEVDGEVVKVEEKVEEEEGEGLKLWLKVIERIQEELDSESQRLDNVRDGAKVLVQSGREEGGGLVWNAVQEMENMHIQVKEHLQSCHLHLQNLLKEAEGSKSAPPISREVVDMNREVAEDTSISSEVLNRIREVTEDTPLVTRPQATVSPTLRASLTETTRVIQPEEGEAPPTEHNVKMDVLLEQLTEALTQASSSLDDAERLMQSSATSRGALGVAQSQSLLECERKVGRVLHLYQLLKTEASTTAFPTIDTQVQEVADSWQRLQSWAKELNMGVSEQQQKVSKFSLEVDGLMAWLDEAEALQASFLPLPSDLLQLKALIRKHRDFEAQLEEKRPRFQSIQLLSDLTIDTTTIEGQRLQSRVQELLRRWEAVMECAAETRQLLQAALLQCQDFHHSMHDYLLWLEGMEGRVCDCEPVDLSEDITVLQDKNDKLKEIYRELADKQPSVLALKETVDQLLARNESSEMAAARERVHIISTRLQALLNKTAGYLQDLEAKLAEKPSSTDLKEGWLPPPPVPPSYMRRRTPFSYFRQSPFRHRGCPLHCSYPSCHGGSSLLPAASCAVGCPAFPAAAAAAAGHRLPAASL